LPTQSRDDNGKYNTLATQYVLCGDLEEALELCGYSKLSPNDARKRKKRIKASRLFKQAVKDALAKHLLKTMIKVSNGELPATALAAARAMCKYYLAEEPTGVLLEETKAESNKDLNKDW